MCLYPELSSSTAHRRGCRCTTCNDWNTAKQKGVIERARARATGGKGCQFPTHKASTSYQYGCRCRRCKRANTVRCRIYRK